MNENESRLEEISNDVSNYEVTRQLPVYEVYISVFSILVSTMLFLFPDMLQNDADNITSLYWLLLSIMPQSYWAFIFFIAGVSGSIGLLIDSKHTRVFSLVLSTVVFAVFGICYAMSFPTIGSISFLSMSLFSIVSIPIVKHTGLDFRE